MLLNFLTAPAWIWGGVFALSIVMGLFSYTPASYHPTKVTKGEFASGILLSLPAWAWLIARYWM